MKKKILLAVLALARAMGLFRMARKLTRHDLRILCYHGAALIDENEFRGGLFVTPKLFDSRMAYLKQHGYHVLPLDDAVRRLYGEAPLPSVPTVITIDDGWLGTATKMASILQRYDFPATLYLSTYYVAKQTQVFDVAVDYVLWKAVPQVIDLTAVARKLTGKFETGLSDQRKAASRALCDYADALPHANDRQAFLRKVCEVVGIDHQMLSAERILSFMNDSEARAIQAFGVDLQLHSHRHRFPVEDISAARAEIVDNRNYLRGLSNGELVHFCYPSGEYDVEQFSLLDELGIQSVTTTQGGFNTKRTHRFEMTRFLDSENVSMIEFEAEMSGFFELIRRIGYAI